VPLRDKIPKAIPMFLRISFSKVFMPPFTGDRFALKVKMAPGNRK